MRQRASHGFHDKKFPRRTISGGRNCRVRECRTHKRQTPHSVIVRCGGDATIFASTITYKGSGDHSATTIFTTASMAQLTSAFREIDGSESRKSAACASKLQFKHSYRQSPEVADSICKSPACSQPQVDPADNSILHVFPRLKQSLNKLDAPCTCRTSEKLTKISKTRRILLIKIVEIFWITIPNNIEQESQKYSVHNPH